MGYLVRLIFLDVSHNSLRNLPPDIMSMRGELNLQYTIKYYTEQTLNIWKNIFFYIALQNLIANSNELEELPSLSELRKVETIMFQNNKLTIFPDLSKCVALKELHLSENNIVVCTLEILFGKNNKFF